jgi:small subunit ribosomal protein S6
VRRYETIFILRPDLGETQVKQSLKRVEDIVANGGGELIETDEWGMRELAYRIRRERRGYYVRLDYVAPGTVMNEVERNLKLMDEALRHLSVMVEEDADAAKLRGEVEARKRRLAEARTPAPAADTQSTEEPHDANHAAAEEELPGAEATAEVEAAPGAKEPPPQGENPAAQDATSRTEAGDGTDEN